MMFHGTFLILDTTSYPIGVIGIGIKILQLIYNNIITITILDYLLKRPVILITTTITTVW